MEEAQQSGFATCQKWAEAIWGRGQGGVAPGAGLSEDGETLPAGLEAGEAAAVEIRKSNVQERRRRGETTHVPRISHLPGRRSQCTLSSVSATSLGSRDCFEDHRAEEETEAQRRDGFPAHLPKRAWGGGRHRRPCQEVETGGWGSSRGSSLREH